MDDNHIRVLLVEDNPGDARLIREMLAEAKNVSFDLEHFDRLETGLERLSKGGIDVSLVDLSLPDSQGVDTVRKMYSHAPEVPMIVLTGLGDETLINKIMQEGTQDYLIKGQVDSNLLVRSIRYAIERLEQRKQAMGLLEKAGAKLAKANFVLSILYKLSNTISQALDYEKLMGSVMDSLSKIVDSDICASLIYDENSVYVTLRPAYPQCSQFTEEVQNRLYEDILLLTGEEVRKKKMNIFVISPNTDAKAQGMAVEHALSSNPDKDRDFTRIRSFFNVPFTIGDETLGVLNVSSCRETAFPEEQQRILYTISNQAANAIERLRRIMKTEKSKMDSMVESMLEGVIMLDEHGQILVLNPQARKMLGFEDTQKVIGKDLYDKLEVLELDKEIEKYLATSESVPISKELVLSQEEGSKTLYCEVIPIRGSEDKFIGVSIILRDITKRKKIEQMKDEFISSVSHELKTPLAIIKEVISLVIDEIPGKIVEAQRDVLVMAAANTLRLSKIIDSLLDISRLEAGKVQLDLQVAEITELIVETVSNFQHRARQDGISLDYEIPPVKLNISCDSDRIRQVLVNFLSNALKFTPRGGGVKVVCKEEENEVIVFVEDTGIGISEVNIPKLFNRFVQIDREFGAGEKGTGLGLAISRELVELHEGRIWAESKVNSGSRFYFSLPKSSSKKPS